MARVFRQYIPIPFLVLGMAEFFLALSAVYSGTEIWAFIVDVEIIPAEGFPLLAKALAFASIVLVSQISMGLYQRRFRYAVVGMVLRIGIGFAETAIYLALLYYILPGFFLEWRVLALSFLIAAAQIIFIRIFFVQFLSHNQLKRRILVLGAGEYSAQISRQLRRKVDRQGFIIIGYVHVHGEHDVVEEALVVRPDSTLLFLARKLRADEIVVAVGERRGKSFPVHDLLDCKLSGIDVIDLLGFFERETGKVKLDILNPSWIIFSDGFNQGKGLNSRKRAFDITVSLMLLFISWPFMLAVLIAIKLEGGGRGAVIYRQIRVGQHWRLFNVYKFRSMSEDAEKGGEAQWAKKNDVRITRVGSFIRMTRLDELPQIFNVLKGDMSFVGPRPERPEFVTQLTEQIPYFSDRHRVKPGITGWAQVCYPYGASEKDSLEKLQFDLYYIKNYSLFLDLVIIFQTAHSVIAGRGGR